MRCLFKSWLALAVAAAGPAASAFTLLGPAADWMTTSIGYNTDAPGVGGGAGAGVGGPMNIGDEFRWNVPTIYYGFSSAFYNYFGERGISEIEKAIKILNDLPSMDAINIDNYPLTSQRVNYQAQALFLVDLKSFALTYLVETMGITDPTRFVFTVRNRWVTSAPQTNYLVIKRNFDPVTWETSSYINGDLWTFTGILDDQTLPTTLPLNEPVDPLAINNFALINAPVSSGLATGRLLPGGFWTGLTRDDVGGLRYIYRSGNQNVESPPSNASSAGFGAVTTGGSSSPWTPIVVPPATTGGTTAPTASSGATNFITTALRPGLGKINFVRVSDPGGLFVSNTVAFTDVAITNNQTVSQNLSRPLQVPDIVFDAGDLQQGDTFANGYQAYLTVQQAWLTNGVANIGAGKYGPGVIPPSTGGQPSFVLTLQSVGPAFFSSYPFPLTETSSGQEFLWASFDGSTNAPFVYPQAVTIQALENAVFGGSGGGSSSGVAGADVWTPAATVLLPPGTVTSGTTTGGGTGTTTQ